MPYLNRPDFYFGIAFNADPNNPAAVPTWNDLTKYVRSASAIARGKQYELGQTLAASPTFLLRDIDENLNSANTASPYYPNVVPYRRALFMGTWPNSTTGNLINTGAWRGNNQLAYDPTFDSYTVASTPWWVQVGGTTLATDLKIDSVSPHSGANDVFVNILSGTAIQGAGFLLTTMPGRTYTASLYARTSVSETVRIGVLGGVTGGSATAAATYTRISVTFTATQPSHVIQCLTVGTVSASNLRIDDIQLEQGNSLSAFTTTGPVIYPIMNAYAERFQKVYADGGFTGYVQVPCVDALAALSQISIPTPYVAALTIQYTPDHYWSLSQSRNPQGFLSFLPGICTKATPTLGGLTSSNGLGTGQVPSTGTPMNIPGDSGGAGVTFSPPATLAGQGAIIASLNNTIAFPAVVGSSGYSATLAAWVIATIRPSEPMAVIWTVPSSYASVQPPFLGISDTGQIYASVGGTLDGAFNSFLYHTDGPVVTDGQPHFLVMTVAQDATNTTMRAYVDGVQVNAGFVVTNASIGGTLLASITGKQVQVGGFFAFTAFENQLQGSVAHAALWNRALSQVNITDLWNAGQGYAGILSGNQVAQHLVTYGKYAGATRISNGSSVMGAPTYTGTIDLLTDTRNTTVAELGNVWAAPDGAVVYEGRQDRYLRTASLYTLGQNVTGGHIPFDESVEFDTDPQYIYVNVQYQRNGGSNAVGGSVTDVQAAALRFFYPPFAASADLLYDATAQDLANWIFYTHNGAVQRVASITISPASNPSLWPFALGLEIGQRVTCSMSAPAANNGAGITFVADFFVEQISHDNIDADTGAWDMTLWMSPIATGTQQSAQPWILGDATWGVLDSTTKLAA